MIFMLWAMLAALPSSDADSPLVLENTGIYDFLHHQMVCVSDAGEFFILDRRGKTVRHFANDGTVLPNIGGPGKLPSQFRHPIKISLFDKKLYVNDLRAFHEFRDDGEFIRKVSIPRQTYHLTKVADGWVGMTGAYPFSPKQPTKLIWYNDSLDEQETLAEWPGEIERNPETKLSSDPGTRYYNPAQDLTVLDINQARDTLVIKLSGTRHVLGFNLVSRAQVFDLEIPGEPIPFDLANGQRLLENTRDSNSWRRIKVQFEPNFPNYFPIIRTVSVSPSDEIVVTKWHPLSLDSEVGLETPEHSRFRFNFNGEQVPQHDDGLPASRVVKMTDQHAYLIFRQPTREWTVARVPREDAKTFLEANQPAKSEDK